MTPLTMPDQPWADQAACRAPDVNADWFHPLPADTYAIRSALNTCSGCPVKPDCLKHALEAGETQGIWGALTDTQRAALKKRGRRAALKARKEIA